MRRPWAGGSDLPNEGLHPRHIPRECRNLIVGRNTGIPRANASIPEILLHNETGRDGLHATERGRKGLKAAPHMQRVFLHSACTARAQRTIVMLLSHDHPGIRPPLGKHICTWQEKKAVFFGQFSLSECPRLRQFQPLVLGFVWPVIQAVRWCLRQFEGHGNIQKH